MTRGPTERTANPFVVANEATATRASEWDIDGLLPFLCECDRRGCVRIISMTLADYRSARSTPGFRVVAPGHEARPSPHARRSCCMNRGAPG